MKNTVLLDSDSNMTIMRNENHIERVWDTNSNIPAETNSGLTTAQHICDLDKFLFSASSMGNVLSLSNTTNDCRATIGTSVERAMKVYFPKQIEKFIELGNRS